MRLIGRTPVAGKSAGELTDELAAMGAALMVEVLADLSACPPVPQPDDGATSVSYTHLDVYKRQVQQDLLYARAETQNVRRRAEKEVADAHAYACLLYTSRCV